jgi:hypothetical protein
MLTKREGAEHDGDDESAESSLFLIAAHVAPGKVSTRSSPIRGRSGARAALGVRMALPDRVAGVASRRPRLSSFSGGAFADVALPNDGFGADGAFLALRGDVLGNPEKDHSPSPCRQRGFLCRPTDDQAFGAGIRSLTAEP